MSSCEKYRLIGGKRDVWQHKQGTFTQRSPRRFSINAEQTLLIDCTRFGSQVFALFYQLPTCERYVKTKEMRHARDILRLSTLKMLDDKTVNLIV